jgi:hypothetical protein
MSRAHRVRSFALACVLASLLVPALTSASARTGPYAETRVRGLDLGNQYSIRASGALTLDTHQGYGPAYDDLASDFLPAARGIRHAIPEGRLGHIFRNAPGHLPDTPANRALLQNVADDAATTLGVDKWGNTWSARTLENGTQVWTQTRGGQIVNGGLNQVPRVFSPDAGLVPPVPGGF